MSWKDNFVKNSVEGIVDTAKNMTLTPDAQSQGSWPTENSGWYYDRQTNPWQSRLTTVSLHCNRKPKEHGKEWVKLSDKEADIQGYSKMPLVTSVLAEDFNIGVNNAWTPFGGDKIGELWGSLKPLAPYAKELGDVLGKMAEQGGDVEKGTWAEALQSVVNYLSKHMTDENGNNIISKYLNRVLITQGARFTYYSGTDVNFSSLGMKFTIFSDWDSEGNFVTVNHKLTGLYPYFIGKLIRNDLKTGNDTADSFLDRYVMWQQAPAGYQPSVDYVDACQEGTFKLRIGSYYSIPNLVISDCQLSFSRQMVKFGGGDISRTLKPATGVVNDEGKDLSELASNGFCPLSCDVSLTFQPATKFSDVMVKALTTGYGMQDSIARTTKIMKSRLLSERARLKNRYRIKSYGEDANSSEKLGEEVDNELNQLEQDIAEEETINQAQEHLRTTSFENFREETAKRASMSFEPDPSVKPKSNPL